ncbi:hypothetical protein ACHHYP_01334 [Achlya hypogyna]|uniref:Uncharacterized protein n=1 Tax=Achlya hypogyna TaxID=1202772 RepID=A0A1V9ZTL9_ACHHY|nr:hypothetical protein ACHHYP_01334 [Achlya hypogyna]
MASLNGLPPIPRSQEWTRKPSVETSRAPPQTARRLNSPQSATSTRRRLDVSMGHLSILRPNNSTASLVDASPRNQGDDENQATATGDDDVLTQQSSARETPDTPSVLDELQRMQTLNNTLQIEVARLQEALVQRLRGNSKFVGGGQFRSSLAPASSPKAAGCSSCYSLRATVKQLKFEIKAAKPIVDDLQVKLSESLVQRQALSAEAARKELQLADTTARLEMADHCIAEQKLQLAQLDADLTNLRERPGSDTEEVHAKLRQALDLVREKQRQLDAGAAQLVQAYADVADGRQRAAALETSLQSTTTLLDSARGAMDALQAQVRASAAQHQQHELDTFALQRAHDQVLLQLRYDVDSWKVLAQAAEAAAKQAADEKGALASRLSQLEEDLRRRLAAMEGMEREAQHLHLLRRKTAGDMLTLNHEVDALHAEIAGLKAERDAAATDHDAVATRLQAELQAARAQLAQLEKALLTKACDQAALEAQVRELQAAAHTQSQRTAEMHSELRDQLEKLGVAQSQVLKQRGQVHALQTELKGARAETDEANARLEGQHQLHTKALEKASAWPARSLVRLCVVAPTVNVHLSGQVLPCKSVLPTDAIRSIVQKDILPVFSSIFLQPDEGMSPAGTSLDAWLQTLLKEMQTSIEKHLKSVFQT